MSQTVGKSKLIDSVFSSRRLYNACSIRPVQPVINLPCKPPNSPPDLFNDFENLIGKIDDTNQELYLVGDMKTNLLPAGIADSNSSKLINVCEILVN